MSWCIPPFGRGFSRHGVFRSDGDWAAQEFAIRPWEFLESEKPDAPACLVATPVSIKPFVGQAPVITSRYSLYFSLLAGFAAERGSKVTARSAIPSSPTWKPDRSGCKLPFLSRRGEAELPEHAVDL